MVNYSMANMMYESLLTLDPTTLKYMPVLATHWQISPDKLTFRFRINPNARWSDGEPVVADDVVRTWVLYSDPCSRHRRTPDDQAESLLPRASTRSNSGKGCSVDEFRHHCNDAIFPVTF